MALFRRKKDNPDVLPELQQYYDAERRERAGLAWLLALVSVVCIALLVIGLFFGGRWIYRTVKNDNKKPTTSNTNNNGNQTKAPSVDGKSTDQGNSGGNSGSTSGGASGGSSTAPAGGSGSTGSTGTTQTPTTTPNTGPDNNLPNTGPDGDY